MGAFPARVSAVMLLMAVPPPALPAKAKPVLTYARSAQRFRPLVGTLGSEIGGAGYPRVLNTQGLQHFWTSHRSCLQLFTIDLLVLVCRGTTLSSLP